MKQGEPPAKIFVDDGVGRAGDGFREAKPTGKSPGEGGLPRPKIAPVGKNRPGGDDLPYRRANFSVSSGEFVINSMILLPYW